MFKPIEIELVKRQEKDMHISFGRYGYFRRKICIFSETNSHIFQRKYAYPFLWVWLLGFVKVLALISLYILTWVVGYVYQEYMCREIVLGLCFKLFFVFGKLGLVIGYYCVSCR